MKRKITLSIALAVNLAVFSIAAGGCSPGCLTIKDKSGSELAVLSSAELDEASPYNAYLDAVLTEIIDIVAEMNSCTEEKAKTFLFDNNYTIDTCFDTEIYSAIDAAYSESDVNGEPFGCAVTDLNGGLCAVYSSDFSDGVNYSIAGFSPYSTLKPLSVYAPVIENKTAYWSKVYEDSPFTQIKENSGNAVNWPENATGLYSNENTTVFQAIKESLNTVAVKCLDDYGVLNSISFLRDNFDINLDFEYKKAASAENEVIGNLAMGYLYEGVSPKDMAGYYQIFANGGKYSVPKAITKVTDSGGNVKYERKDDSKQVISESTSYIMNKLLQGVTEIGGTGTEAKPDGIPAGGKTGTGTANDCHWFVGFVPEYSCAVWHGGSMEKNYSPLIFNKIMSGINLENQKLFPEADGVKQAVFCKESGLLCTQYCTQIDLGYYFADSEIGYCKIHRA